MKLSLAHIIINATTLLAIMNPFGNVSLFVSMTEHMEKNIRKKLFNLIVYTGFTIVVLFGMLGDLMLKYLFKVEMTHIKVAGGLLLIIVAIKNLLAPRKNKKKNNKNINNNCDMDVEETNDEDELHKGIIPMAFPILVGPGSMPTILIIRKENGILTVILSSILAFIIIKILLAHSHIIEKIFGKLVLFVLARVMQIFIMATGVKLLSSGILEIIFQFNIILNR